mmetsp:Transcript_7963/g.10939  ORF Transcript_7963/g.10939 Transcript_7963/m.10939 type:complete len:109 (-) Transcript_7963:531-857(-)
MKDANCDEKVAASQESPGLVSSQITEGVAITSQESSTNPQTPGLRNYLDLNKAPKPLADLHLRRAGQIIGLYYEDQWYVGEVRTVDKDSETAGFNWADYSYRRGSKES